MTHYENDLNQKFQDFIDKIYDEKYESRVVDNIQSSKNFYTAIYRDSKDALREDIDKQLKILPGILMEF